MGARTGDVDVEKAERMLGKEKPAVAFCFRLKEML